MSWPKMQLFGFGLLVIHMVGTHLAETIASPTDSKPLVVTTIFDEPYVYECSNPLSHDCIPVTLDGNTTHAQGFLMDLLKKLAEKGGFRYEVHRVKDAKYGMKDETAAGGWNGMIGELIRNEADLGLAAFTVTSEREEVVNFTAPFLDHVGLSVVLKKPLRVKPIGKAPMEPLMLPFNNVEELANQTDITYGVVKNSGTSKFFQKSKVDPYKRMWTIMNASPEQSFLQSYREAIERVRRSQGRFVFFMETPPAQYLSRHYCDTIALEFDKGVEYNAKGYSLGLRSGSEWTPTLSRLIEELKAEGSIAAMYDKWWRCECTIC